MTSVESKETMTAGFPELRAASSPRHRDLCRKNGYQLVIFDFDGTLADSFSWFLRVINDVADTYKFRRIKVQELPKLRSYDARRMLEHAGIPRWKMPLIQRHVRKRMTREIANIALFPGIGALLQRLHAQSVILAIVTSNSFINVREVLGRQNASLIQHYACDAPILGKRVKLRRVLHDSGVLSSEAIFIGDEIRDLHAARAEEIAFGAVSWGVNSPESLSRHFPEEIFSSIDEIADRLTRPRFVEAPVRSNWQFRVIRTSARESLARTLRHFRLP
jgi:phosphoglycolate phosphatase